MTGTALLIVLGLVLAYGVLIYNNLVDLKHAITKSWANIDVLLKQRSEELPKLVAVCREQAGFERETLERVMQARNAVHGALESGDVAALGRAETELKAGLGRLFAVVESYPELRTNESYQHLASRITQLEHAIADRREYYNESVNLNNVRIEQLPDVFVARLCGFRPADLFQVTDAERRDVDVSALFRG